MEGPDYEIPLNKHSYWLQYAIKLRHDLEIELGEYIDKGKADEYVVNKRKKLIKDIAYIIDAYELAAMDLKILTEKYNLKTDEEKS